MSHVPSVTGTLLSFASSRKLLDNGFSASAGLRGLFVLFAMKGLQSETKSIKMTLKGTKTPATVTDSGQSTKEDGKVKEEKEEPIGKS